MEKCQANKVKFLLDLEKIKGGNRVFCVRRGKICPRFCYWRYSGLPTEMFSNSMKGTSKI